MNKLKHNSLALWKLHSSEKGGQREDTSLFFSWNFKMCVAIENMKRHYEKRHPENAICLNAAELITMSKARRFNCQDKKPFRQRNGFPFPRAFAEILYNQPAMECHSSLKNMVDTLLIVVFHKKKICASATWWISTHHEAFYVTSNQNRK